MMIGKPVPECDKECYDDIKKKYKIDDKSANSKIFGDMDKDGILNAFDRKPKKKSKMFDVSKLI